MRVGRSSVPGGRERRTLVAVAGPLFALALALPAHAGDERILGKDDLPFVRALVRNGYPDLAEELLTTIETTRKGSADDALWAQALRLELQEAAAYGESDPVQQGQKLQATVDAMEAFVKAHPGTGATEALSDRLLELYRGFGERVAALLKDETTASEAEALRGTGDKMFTRAIETLKADREALAEKIDKQDPDDPDPDLDRRAMIAAYNLARTYYFAAQLQQDEYLRDTRLKAAMSVLSDIQLEYSDQLLCYEGYIYEGLCHRDMGKPDEALVSFDYAIGLRDTYERSGNGVVQMPPEAADIVSSAVLQKMLVLAGKGDQAGAIAVSRDFFATIPDPAATLRGLAILEREAESCKESGDQKGLQAAAQKLVDLDPRGPAGERGRELLGTSTSSLGAADTFVLAQAAARRNDMPRAIALCQETLRQARGSTGVGDLGGQATLLLGALLAQRNWLHEAVVVWSSVSDRYADGKDAPECLWRAANGYLALQAQERSTFYRDGAREVMTRLSQRYPQHQYASMAAIIEGQQLEAESKFTEAVQAYQRIPAGSAGYEEALYRAGNALARLARQQFQENKSADGKANAVKAEELLKKAQTELEAAAGKTLDLGQQDRLRGLAFNARVAIANLYLTKGIDRGAEALKLFESPEREFASDPVKLSAAQALRLKALQATGKVDDAVAMLDAALKADPSGKSVASNASFLARALDERGVAQKATSSVDADASWRKAASLYVLAVRGQIEGSEAVRVDELEPIANRLFALGLHFNGVPENVDSFTEWTGTRLDDELLSVAARAYETLLPLTPSYRTRMNLARTLGFLKRWEEAATGYAQLFEREAFANTGARSIDPDAMREKPELLSAFLEWGVCEREVGIAQRAPDRLSRASAIFETLVLGTRAESRSWWMGKFYQLQTLVDRGEYDLAAIALRDIQLHYPDYDAGQFGLKGRFETLGTELSRKTFDKQ